MNVIFRFIRGIFRGSQTGTSPGYDLPEVIDSILLRLDDVEKKAEATRRKVYRDIEKSPEGNGDLPAFPPVAPVTDPLAHLRAGDPVPPELLRYL